MRVSQWSPPVLQGEAVKIVLASVSSGICAMWPNREKHCACNLVSEKIIQAIKILLQQPRK